MTALAIRENQQLQSADVMSTAPTLDRDNLNFFANMIEAANLIPVDRNTPSSVQKARVMAKIVAGTYYGFDPISAQENLAVIQGRVVLSARGMAQLLHRSGKYATRVEKLDDEGCKLAVLEKNEKGEWVLIGHVEFTKAMAQKAGLLDKLGSLYKTYSQDMYFARCITRVVRRFAPGVLDGQQINYDLAKKEVVAETSTVPQIPSSVPNQIGQAYQDPVVSDFQTEQSEPEIEAEFVEASQTKDESTESKELLERLILAKTKGDAAERKKILKGKPIEQMSDDEVIALIDKLSSEEAV